MSLDNCAVCHGVGYAGQRPNCVNPACPNKPAVATPPAAPVRNPLANLVATVKDMRGEAARLALATLLTRMREIEGNITPSLYTGNGDAEDRPPTGDDYNLLWDAILDEINAAAVG